EVDPVTADKFRNACLESNFGACMQFVPAVSPSFRHRFFKNMMENAIFIPSQNLFSILPQLPRIDGWLDLMQSRFCKSRLEPLLVVLNELEFIFNKNSNLNAKDPFLEIVKRNLVKPNTWDDHFKKLFDSRSGDTLSQVDDERVVDAFIKMSEEAINWAVLS